MSRTVLADLNLTGTPVTVAVPTGTQNCTGVLFRNESAYQLTVTLGASTLTVEAWTADVYIPTRLNNVTSIQVSMVAVNVATKARLVVEATYPTDSFTGTYPQSISSLIQYGSQVIPGAQPVTTTVEYNVVLTTTTGQGMGGLFQTTFFVGFMLSILSAGTAPGIFRLHLQSKNYPNLDPLAMIAFAAGANPPPIYIPFGNSTDALFPNKDVGLLLASCDTLAATPLTVAVLGYFSDPAMFQ